MLCNVLRNHGVALLVMMGVGLGISNAAQAFYCANCGTEWTQLANNLQLVKQLEQQVLSVQQQIKQYENMLLNSNPLKSLVWSNALGEIKQLNALLEQAKSLSFASANLEQAFAQKYGDYQSYVAQSMGDETLSTKYQQWSEDTNDSVLTTLKAAKLQSEQITGAEDTYLRHLEQLASSNEGRMQALQVSNQIALHLARQMQKLRQLMLVQMQLQANYMQMVMDREVAQQAAWKNFSKKPDVTLGNGKKYTIGVGRD